VGVDSTAGLKVCVTMPRGGKLACGRVYSGALARDRLASSTGLLAGLPPLPSATDSLFEARPLDWPSSVGRADPRMTTKQAIGMTRSVASRREMQRTWNPTLGNRDRSIHVADRLIDLSREGYSLSRPEESLPTALQ
jgi:hypothetical protein